MPTRFVGRAFLGLGERVSSEAVKGSGSRQILLCGWSTEALVGIATGFIEAGLCKTVAIFRSMNGCSQVRSQRDATPAEAFKRHFGPEHGVELPPRVRYGYRPVES